MKRKFDTGLLILYLSIPVSMCIMHFVWLFADAARLGALFVLSATTAFWLPSVLSAVATMRVYKKGGRLWLNSIILCLIVVASCVLYFSLMYAEYFASPEEHQAYMELFIKRSILSSLVGVIFVLIFNLVVFAGEKMLTLKESNRKAIIWIASFIGVLLAYIPITTDFMSRTIDDVSIICLLIVLAIPVVITCFFCKYTLSSDGKKFLWALAWLGVLAISSAGMSLVSLHDNPEIIFVYSAVTVAINAVAIGVTCLIDTITRKIKFKTA